MFRFSVYPASPGREDGRAPERQPSPARAPAQRSLFRPGRVWRSQSSQNLRDGERSSSPGYSSRAHDITDDLNTLPDPRKSTDGSTGTDTPPREFSARHEHGEELAALTTKLINSINHQTSLDDSLQRTRHELEAAQEQKSLLEQTVRKYEERVENGVLIERAQADKMEQKLRTELAAERSLRIAADKERKGMEMELENLTSSLFEQANTMVADARRNNANADRRSEQLKLQLRDSEVLLASHQQQLRELKAMLEQIQQERDEAELSATPQTPVTASRESLLQRSLEMTGDLRPILPSQPVAIDQPLRFSELIRPVLRNDLPAYEEFITIVQSAARMSPSSRVSSGSLGGALNAMGMNQNQPTGASLPVPSPSPSPANTSTSPSLPGSFTTSTPLDTTTAAATATLEKSKFYKRLLSEDIDPTLRLDAAPGLSFFARRTVVSSIMSGAFVIEPWPPGSRYHSPVFACALCGEQRRGEPYIRRHRFRASDSDDAQRYPLCAPCLEKVRATCELVGFLKMLRNGQIWRAEGELEEARLARMAWEDCVRLRERMFWARVGGGVVPVYKPDDASSPVESSQPGPGVPVVAPEDATTPQPGEVEGGSEAAPAAAPALLVHQASASSEADAGDAFVDATETPTGLGVSIGADTDATAAVG